MSQNRLHTLSRTEVQIIEGIQKGASLRKIADSLHISSESLRLSRSNITRKLKLKGSSALVTYANRIHLELYERYGD